MWGGGGGLIEYRSALLASHGYASLAVEYLRPGELQSAQMEFSYFEVCMKRLMFLFDAIFIESLPVSVHAAPSPAHNGIKHRRGHHSVIKCQK